MVKRGWLIDITRCIGCRGCQVSCKRWNNRPAEETSLSQDWTNPHRMSSKTYTFVNFHIEYDASNDRPVWHFVKQQCMHCLNPPCMNVCPTSAIYKRDDGAVLIHHERCIGCGYCVVACPYDARHYDKDVKATIKCTMCFDRIDEGKLPTCIQTCPALVMEFGSLEEIRREANRRADEIGGYVYGDEDELIGTQVIYVSDIPLETLGFPPIDQRPPSEATFRNLLPSRISEVVFGGAVAGIVGFVLWRQSRLEKAKMEALSKGVKSEEG